VVTPPAGYEGILLGKRLPGCVREEGLMLGREPSLGVKGGIMLGIEPSLGV